ncbi:Os09g0479000, partial [Oryza sativa Japonica Group]
EAHTTRRRRGGGGELPPTNGGGCARSSSDRAPKDCLVHYVGGLDCCHYGS